MAKKPDTPKPHRPTLREQMEAQHEVLMALVTKSPRAAAQTISLAERTSGPNSGDLYLKLDLVQREEETDADFVARVKTFTQECIDVRDELNAAQAAKRAAGETGDGGE